eukprot:4047148-Prymnesium_polylepis.1
MVRVGVDRTRTRLDIPTNAPKHHSPFGVCAHAGVHVVACAAGRVCVTWSWLTCESTAYGVSMLRCARAAAATSPTGH